MSSLETYYTLVLNEDTHYTHLSNVQSNRKNMYRNRISNQFCLLGTEEMSSVLENTDSSLNWLVEKKRLSTDTKLNQKASRKGI